PAGFSRGASRRSLSRCPLPHREHQHDPLPAWRNALTGPELTQLAGQPRLLRKGLWAGCTRAVKRGLAELSDEAGHELQIPLKTCATAPNFIRSSVRRLPQ